MNTQCVYIYIYLLAHGNLALSRVLIATPARLPDFYPTFTRRFLKTKLRTFPWFSPNQNLSKWFKGSLSYDRTNKHTNRDYNFIYIYRWTPPYIYFFSINTCPVYIYNIINFKTGSTLKCWDALGFDFTSLTHLCFSVALYIYILAL